MTQLAALAIRLGALPSALEREDPEVIDEMLRLLHETDSESSPNVPDVSDLAARMRGR